MRRILRENGLSIVVFTCFFLVFFVGQSLTGHQEYNNDQQEHGQPTISYGEYLATGHFLEATMENWESEFLQMGLYVLLTAYLYQKGSAESKKLGEKEKVDRDPRKSKNKKDAPWPVRQGGLVLKLYENSLFLAFMLLFLFSFWFHAVGGARVYNEEQAQHGGEMVTSLQYMGTSRFWFESLQNWQSEFLAVFAIVVLSIFLRQKGSPESKPVDAPHSQTGE
ncbi:MAG TPA: DUF6766 family protein [Pyrinomonadaceae bacterium]|nr:DUF6766 family protein [Pyrinomonadaceae bacterium]